MARLPNWGDPGDVQRYASELNSEQVQATAPKSQTQDLSKSNPLPWQRYIDPSVSDNLVNQQLGRVFGKSANAFDVTNNINPDGSYKTQPTNTGDYFNQSQLKGVDIKGGAPKSTGNAMLDAINNKYASQYANKYSALGTQSGIDKTKWQSNQLANTGAILGNVQANAMQNFKEQYAYQQQRQQLFNQWQNANEQAKGSFLSSLLQIGLGAASLL